MDIIGKVEQYSIFIISSLSLIIPIADFVGVLEYVPWISQRVPMMTLFSVGALSLYMVVSQKRTKAGECQKVKTVTYDEGYKELQKKILIANNRIIILTQYINIFDWEKRSPKWDPARKESSHRKDFYHTIHSKLNNEKYNANFSFVHIIQIPEDRNLYEILQHDSTLAESCNKIVYLSKKKPEFACLRRTEVNFGTSLILIDDNFAHISFDIHNPNDHDVDAPFVLLIDAPNSNTINHLNNLCGKVEKESKKVGMSDLIER